MAIWYKDIVDFFNINNVLVFYPTSEMEYHEKLNSIMRMVLYLSVILYTLKNDIKVFILFIVVGIVTYILFSLDENKEKYLDDKFEYGEYEEDEKELDEMRKCTMPNKDNPFMNVMMNEYVDNPKRKKACKINKTVDKYIDTYFNEDLYRSIDDIYNKNASERQYYTMPVTEIPNNQDKFAQWLYGIDEKTCKEGNGLKCKYFS
uniref:Minor capsid protein P9 transmembrane helices domain-containing protein n=1 Tax=Pyramimonas orientalis virus TaxID=455367 RepID=A0A7L9AXT7_POV01|nr:hypothetical protein HWQ62_00313 [Pyramimonas orientalis virus]